MLLKLKTFGLEREGCSVPHNWIFLWINNLKISILLIYYFLYQSSEKLLQYIARNSHVFALILRKYFIHLWATISNWIKKHKVIHQKTHNIKPNKGYCDSFLNHRTVFWKALLAVMWVIFAVELNYFVCIRSEWSELPSCVPKRTKSW